MKLTKKLEAEILKAYKECWMAYLKGDIKTHASFLSEKFKIIGTSEGEQYDSKKEWISYCKKTVNQFAGVIQKRKSNIKLLQSGEGVMVIENAHIYVLIDDTWNFYSKIRISALLQQEKTVTGWKYIHQHGSFPDAKAKEDEPIATEQIKAENLQLREAVKRRTTELENKNRELEIEASLERVRAVAMSMNKPDDLLNICEILFKELHTLEFREFRNTMINIHNDQKGFLLNYDYSDVIGKSIIPYYYNIHPVVENEMKQLRSAKDAFSEMAITGKELEDWKELRKRQGEKDDPRLANVSALYYYFYSIGTASIGISTTHSINQENHEILKRFRNVFDLAYRRYNDIALAEAQVREAQIEAALERVRSKAMAMHRSEDLAFPVATIFEELEKLNLGMLRCGIGILDKEKRSVDVWTTTKSDKGVIVQVSGDESMDSHPLLKGAIDAWVKQEDYDYTLEGEDLYSYYKTQGGDNFKLPLSPLILSKTEGLKEYYHLASFKAGGLYAFRETAFPDEAKIVMKRFAFVFEQTYTRFLDLQKAEAQAREAQIEATLEKVRSASLAMQKSDELKNVITVVFERLKALGFSFEDAGIQLYTEGSQDIHEWVAAPDQLSAPTFVNLPYSEVDFEESEIFRDVLLAKEKGENIFNKAYSFNEKNRYFSYVGKHNEISLVPEELRKFQLEAPCYIITLVAEKNSALWVDSWSEQTISTEDFHILKRVARVFDQAYTRFLDLQKAEAQAREAKIESSLERVRSRTMAMQRSDELADVAMLLFQQVKELGITAWTTGFNIWQADNASYIDWITGPSGDFLEPYTVDLTSFPVFIAVREARQRGDDFFVSFVEGEQIVEMYKLLNSFGNKGQFQKILDSGIPFPTRQFNHFVFGAQVSLLFITYEPVPEAHDIFKRFGKVFEQTYTRFLDLQKAEAQARENQIQLALERVRARTMAMQRSEELEQVVVSLFDRLVELGLSFDGALIFIFEKEKRNIRLWIATNHLSAPVKIDLPYDEEIKSNGIIIDLWNAIETGEHIFNRSYSGETKNDYFRYVAKYNESKIPESVRNIQIESDSWTAYFAAEKNSIIGFDSWSGHNITSEDFQTLKRFSKVFEQSYTRFLDLQKAEAQAREAKIETALERVRARTMAMQKSDELDETNMLIMRQLESLDISLSGTGIHICYADKPVSEAWMGDPLTGKMPKVIYNHTHDRLSEKMYEGWKKGETLIVEEVKGEKLKEHFEYLLSLLPDPTIYEDSIQEFVCHIVYFTYGFFVLATPDHRPTEHPVFIRFAKVFEQTYIRFLDLQKAEAQAREARIETALEKIRSRSLGMHRSVEIKYVVAILFEKLKELDLEFDGGAAIHLFSGGSKNAVIWVASPDLSEPSCVNLPYDENAFEGNPIIMDVWKAKETGEHIYNKFYSFEEKNIYFDYVFKHNDFITIPEPSRELILQAGSYTASFIAEKNSLLGANSWTRQLFSDNDFEVLKRIARVFEQAYIRFLDLQKAEAQSREAQIELGLERVRARAMAMQNSEELNELVATLFEELIKLDLILSRCIIWIFDADTLSAKVWMANSEDKKSAQSYFIKRLQHPYYEAIIYGWKERKATWVYELQGAEKKSIDEMLFYETELSRLPDSVKAGILASGHTIISGSFNNFGLIEASGPEHQSDEQLEILNRFGKVFDLTYTRFNDLKQAEAQAREAKIEAALERVRSKTIAMHKSDELLDIIIVVSEQLQQLNIKFGNVSFGVNNQNYDLQLWMAVKGNPKAYNIHWAFLDNPGVTRLKEAQQQPDRVYTDVLTQAENNEWLQHIFNCNPSLDIFSEEARNKLLNSRGFARSIVVMADIFLVMGNYAAIPYTNEENAILKRFANVFEQAYKRFLDLQKAEAQTREATIEAALEKVRGKAMGMNDSKDLSSTIVLAFSELKKLGINPLRFGVGLINKELHKAQLYAATSSADGDGLALIGWIVFKGHPVFENIFDSWIKNEDYYPVLEGEQLKSYYELLLSGLSVPKIPDWQSGEKQYGHFFPQPVSCLYAWANQPLNAADIRILKRFASIIELTFRRYLELQKSETNARDAIRRASLDRVRAETASMRTTADLEKITPLIWNELTTLGVPFIRCGVFIMDEAQQEIHTFLSTPDGKAIAAFHLPYHTTEQITQIVAHWQQKKFYKDYWDEAAFDGWTKTLVQKGIIASQEQYVTAGHPANLHLHFLPFLQGMLYVGNEASLNEEEIRLVQSLAEAFSTAYARYEDFNKLESAKEQIEKTLVDLKQAQTQLVQSEKMASLGELTAGIAHEIQNPLNFVNNFSDVNTELIEELKKELKEGNSEEVIAIANDIKANEEKINHHGKRADSIVKGMLQHSRRSSAVKEPTDINKLADEYLRLAYHGLRAKDKSFNATMKTDFDEHVGNINIIPQDIGRVLLNLYNNAFYAALLPPPAGGGFKDPDNKHEPTVWVSTKKVDDRVLISVRDNGSGIPQNIIDKIFQPFFTTKPTGQGTGLGLSLAYDIVKAHGGELKVETMEGEGSEFIIQLTI